MRNTKCVAEQNDKPFPRSKAEWFIFYCLCSKYKMMNTKAKFMIVTPTNPKKSSLMITNNAVSTIAPPPVVSLTS